MKTMTATSEKTVYILEFETNGRKIELTFPTSEEMVFKSADLKREKISPKKYKKVVQTTEKTTIFNI